MFLPLLSLLAACAQGDPLEAPGPLVGAEVLRPANAQESNTVAVLDLEQAAGSEEYAGLGQALAGMLVADLSAVPTLTLVERARLEALLTEMKLSEGAFIDPATAQKLGKGLGARYLVLGSYSVVKDTFLLDARLVEVEGGKVVKAAKANGPVTDFVGVEKTLVEDLLAGLEVALTTSDRRKILVQAPTESFDAMAAYGAGLDAQDKGQLEAAQAAFERAITADPAFEEAAAALDQVKAALEAAKSARAGRFSAEFEAMNQKVLGAYPDERKRSLNQPDDMDLVVGFALRLVALENMEQDCQRVEEMEHYLERVKWQVKEPPKRATPDEKGRTPGVFSYEFNHEAEDVGLKRLPREAGGPFVASAASVYDRGARLWSNLAWYLYGGRWYAFRRSDGTSGFFNSVVRCKAPAQQLKEVDRVKARLKELGLLSFTPYTREEPGVTMEDYLDLTWIVVHSWHIGVSAEFTRRVEGLLARSKATGTDMGDDAVRRETFILQQVEQTVREAELVGSYVRQRVGLTPEEIVATEQAAKDGKLIREGASCALAAARLYDPTSWLASWNADSFEEKHFYMQRELASAAEGVRLVHDFGCLEGVKPRFTAPEQVYPLAKGALEAWKKNPVRGERDICVSMAPGLEGLITAWPQVAADQKGGTAVSIWGQVVGMAQHGCIPSLP